MNFKDFNDFKLKIEEMNNNDYQESLNDLFYFFKDQVEKDEYKEWRPDVEVTYFGLDNEFDKGITFTLGEVSEFLKTKFFSGKIEAIENFHNDNTKDVKAWTPPEVKVPEVQTTNVQRESNSIRNDDDDLEIDRNISVDDEEYFDNQEDEELEEEESFEDFLEEFLGDDEDSDGETVGPKDKNKKKKKKKVKVLGEELPFEDDDGSNHQKEMATEKAMIEDAKSRHEGNVGLEVEVEIDEVSNGDKNELETLKVIEGNEHYDQGSSVISETYQSSESLDFEQREYVQDENFPSNTEPSVPSTEASVNNDELLEIDFGEDWNKSEEAKLSKLVEEQEQSSINPILGVAAGISKALNGNDYEYQGEDAKLFGQQEQEEPNHQKEAATEAAIIELARKRAEQNVQIELIEEDSFEQGGNPHGFNDVNKSHKTMEEALNETIDKMGSDLDDIGQYDEHGQIIHPEAIIDRMLSEDENAAKAFQGHGSAGDMSVFGQAFKDFASQIGNDNNSGYGNGSNVADILNGLVMGMAFTGSGDQIRETAPEPVASTLTSSTESIRGVHESADGRNLGVESGFNLDDYGNLKTAAQERYEAEKRDNYEIGQDTRDIQKFVDAAVADKDARDALMVQSYGQEMVMMPASTMMQGEDFNRLYMEHFADVTAVEFSATPIPENVNTVDFSVAGNGAVLGYEENGVLYITAAPPTGSDLSMVTEPQVYLNPDSAGMFKDAVNLQSVSFGDNIADTSYVHNMGGMFINCENLTTVNADYLNTERLQNIDGLFANCSNLETFNNEGWKTGSVITASFAFSECHALMQDPSANWHMENLRYADGFMSGCTSLTNIDMSDWNARSLLSTREMFNGCTSAEYININGLDTINVRDMAGMFKCCESLEDINLSKLNTSSLAPVVEGKGGVWGEYKGDLGHPIDDVFYGCTKLAENGEFKSQAMAWETSANRSVELNSPVYMESKSHPTSYEQLSIPVMTEVQNKDGSISRMTSYHNQDGSTTFVIPSETPQFNYERMLETQSQYNEPPVMIMSKPNNDGTTSIITSKTYADNSRVVQTEVVGVDGQVIQGNVVSYDKFGMQTSDIPLSRIDEIFKNNSLFVSSKTNEDGSLSVITSRTYEDSSKIIKTETYGKDGKVIGESFASFDGNGAKMTEVPASKIEDLAMTSAAVVLVTANRDGTASIVTSKAYADNSHVVKTELVGRDGNVTKENVVSYDKNGTQMFSVPTDKMQDIQQDGLKLSDIKVNIDGSLTVSATKTFGDNSKIINTEVFGQQGVLKNEFVAYDKNGVKLDNISSSKLEELMKLNSESIVLKSNGNDTASITATKTLEDGSKIIRTETINKDGANIKNEFTAYDKNGTQISNISESKLEELAKMNTAGITLVAGPPGGGDFVVTTKVLSDNSKVVKTEEFDKYGALLKGSITGYDKNGTQAENIPSVKLEELMKVNADGMSLKTEKNGDSTIVTTKTFDNNTQIVKSEMFEKGSMTSKDSIVVYDKNGDQVLNVPSAKLEELLKSNVNTVEFEKNAGGSITINTMRTSANTNIAQSAVFDKDGNLVKNTVSAYDKDGVQIDGISSTKLEELMQSSFKNVEIKKNDDGTILITSTQKGANDTQLVRKETLSKDGTTVKDIIEVQNKYGKKEGDIDIKEFHGTHDSLKVDVNIGENGSVWLSAGKMKEGKWETVATKSFDVHEMRSPWFSDSKTSVSTAVNDGKVTISTIKEFEDGTMGFLTIHVGRDGTMSRTVSGSDKNREISKEQLEELLKISKIDIVKGKQGSQEVTITIPTNDGSKIINKFDIGKDGKASVRTELHGKDGVSRVVSAAKALSDDVNTVKDHFSKGENSNRKRRESKGNGGHAFGDSKSSSARRIFDDATFKRDQNLYKAQKVVEGFGRDSKTVLKAVKQGMKNVIESPQDDSLATETYRKLEKYRGVAKDVASGIFGVSIAASLKAEQVNFKKTMKVAEMTKGLESQGLNLKILEGKSQKEAIESLSGLKDSHGKQLLSEKQIKNIAKYRNGAVDMINFEKAMTNARDIGLFKIEKGDTSLSKQQVKTLERFKSGRLDKLSSKDIANLADAYFKRSKSSALRGIEVSKFSKTELDSIINGKHAVIDWNKLSETEKNIFKGLRQSASMENKRKSIRNNQTLKRLNPFRMSNVMNALRKSGSGLAEETAQLYSSSTRIIGLVYKGVETTLDIARIYGGIASRVGGRAMRSKIVVKARGKVVEALGQTKIGRKTIDLSDSIKNRRKAKRIAKNEKKQLKEMKKEAKLLKKTERNNAIKDKAKEKLKKGAKKAADKAQRTAAGKLAAKAALRLKAMTNNRAFKMAADIFGWSKGVVAVPLKFFGKVGHALGVLKAAIDKLLLYLAAGLIGFFLLCIIFIAIISMFTTAGSTGITINSSIMSPPAVDEYGNTLDLTEEEHDERWEDFKTMLQERYQDCKNEQTSVLDNVESIFNSTPVINGSPVIGWAGDRITEYGVSSDPDNQGCWIAYKPTADDNAKDAIAFAYVIMGADNFYYEEEARDKLIEDLILKMNPKVGTESIVNTVNPFATYSDDTKKIYACLTGCDSLTYYCADLEAYASFSKTGCKKKSKDYEGTVSAKDLKRCVRLSEDGTGIVANGTKIPNASEPVLYADGLKSHKYGDSYTSTCTGAEKVKIKYKYEYETSVLIDVTASKYEDYYGYSSNTYSPSSDCFVEGCGYLWGAHYHFYDWYGNLATSVGENSLKIYDTVTKESDWKEKKVKLSDFDRDFTHGTKTVTGGINTASQVTGPTKSIEIDEDELIDYLEDYVTEKNVVKAKLESDIDTNCSSWKVEFKCEGHDINTCPNGHTDLGVTVRQYSVEDFTCFGLGGAVQLPSNSLYQSYINEFMNLETREGALSMIKAIVENDWNALYGIAGQDTLSIAENSKIGEAYIYNFLISEPDDNNIGIGLGMTKAQAAAMLGYIKVASDFQINKEFGEYYGLCLWGEDQLDRIGRGSSDNQATLLEQLILLNNEWGNTISSCGFERGNDLIEFRACDDTVEGATKAAEILTTKWTFGHVDDVGAVQSAAVNYFNRMNSGSDKDFANPCLSTISNYVSQALKIAASPEHGYCQGKFQAGHTGDFACGSFCTSAIVAGTEGTSDPLSGWVGNSRFRILDFPDGVTKSDLQFGDLIYDPMEAGETSDHIEIYIGNGCSVGARGADGAFGCSASDERWKKHKSSWTDHVFHKSGDQGLRWRGGGYTYDEIAASSSDLSKYKRVLRLMP